MSTSLDGIRMTCPDKRYLVSLLVPLALLVIQTPCLSQEQEAGDRSRIVGYLFDAETNEPISEVTLTLEPVGRTALTNGEGRFQIPNLHPGEYTLWMEHVGYGEQSIDVDVPADRTLEVNIPLAPEAIELEPLEVRVDVTVRDPRLDRVGYYERKRRSQLLGHGHFIDGSRVERSSSASNLLSTIPGLRQVGGGNARGLVAFNRHRRSLHGGPCFPAIYLDGQKVVGSVATGPGRRGSHYRYVSRLGNRGINSLISISSIAAVEVYKSAASTAGEFQASDTRCGVIALWTQAGPDPDSANR